MPSAFYLGLMVIGLVLLVVWSRSVEAPRLPQRGGGSREVLLPGQGSGVAIAKEVVGIVIFAVGSVSAWLAGQITEPTIPVPIPHPLPDQVVGIVYLADGTRERDAVVRLVLDDGPDGGGDSVTASCETDGAVYELGGYLLEAGGPAPTAYRVEARAADDTLCGEPQLIVLPTDRPSGERRDFTCPDTGSVE